MKVKTTAENRKDVVKAMEEILNVKAKYQGPPSFGYKVGEYTVDRDGNVEHESEEAALTMQNELVARGLAEGEADRLNIGIPIEGFTAEGIKNLIYMIHSKQYLLEKAVGKEVFRISDKLVERLDAEENIPLEKVIQIAEEESIEGLAFGEDRIFFCGFPLNEDEARAYAELAACMAKTANGNYIWQPSVSVGVSDMILNRPYYTSTFAPEVAAGATPLAFGDFSYYWIADREGRSFKRLNELYATTGQVGFLASQRVDGKLILPEAVKLLSMKSA